MNDPMNEPEVDLDVLTMQVGELAAQIAQRGTGTIHTLVEFPNGEAQSIHVAVTYGTNEAPKVMQAIEAMIDENGNAQKMVRYSENGPKGQSHTPWMKPV